MIEELVLSLSFVTPSGDNVCLAIMNKRFFDLGSRRLETLNDLLFVDGYLFIVGWAIP
jgi:hypothetical protein